MAKWYNLVEKYEQSGKSKKTFCAEEGIKSVTFYYWCKKYREHQKEEKEPQGFIALTTKEDKNIILRYRNGVELELPVDVSMKQLSDLIQLGGC